MAHCAIYEKGSDQITYFIRDCLQDGRNFKGSNGSCSGVKEHCFDVKWTDDDAEPGGSVKGLIEAKRYQGRVVSTAADVNAVIREQIATKYSIEDEIKILRLKLSGDDTGWKEYQEHVNSLVNAGREYKEKEMKDA
jgi:hypothetical protein